MAFIDLFCSPDVNNKYADGTTRICRLLCSMVLVLMGKFTYDVARVVLRTSSGYCLNNNCSG